MSYAPNFVQYQAVDVSNIGTGNFVGAKLLTRLAINPLQTRHKVYCQAQTAGFAAGFGGHSMVFQFQFRFQGNPVGALQFVAAVANQPTTASIPSMLQTNATTPSGISLLYADLFGGAGPILLLPPYSASVKADELLVNISEAFQIQGYKLFLGILTN